MEEKEERKFKRIRIEEPNHRQSQADTEEVVEAELEQIERDSPEEEDVTVREVSDKKSEYSLTFSEQVDHWPEEEMLAEVVREMDKEDRQEAVARSMRKFWAEKFLIQELWNK